MLSPTNQFGRKAQERRPEFIAMRNKFRFFYFGGDIMDNIIKERKVVGIILVFCLIYALPVYAKEEPVMRVLPVPGPVDREGKVPGPKAGEIPSQLIGLLGGEIRSGDGSLTLQIPAGALREETLVAAGVMDKKVVKERAGGREQVLSYIGIKPSGLVLDKAARVIHRLRGVYVPGTPIKIGQVGDDGEIEEKMFVPVEGDGRTVQFSIRSFGRYAAIKDMVSQGAPIGGGVEVPLPDMFTGAFSHAVALSIVPGRKGMQPNLSLTYRSGGGNSWVGVGFSLNPGQIVRSTRLGSPSYDDTQDTFYFVSGGGTTELAHLIDNVYQAKIESSFTKFYKESGDSWKVVGKDGSRLYFGQSAAARETSPKGTYSWYLTKAEDTNANYMEYRYTQDEGKSYLSRIDYTGNELGDAPAANRIEFRLEGRPDVSSSYMSTARIATAKRLKEIQVKAGGELVWRYELEYSQSEDTQRSLLQSIRQYAGDGKELPRQKFMYQSSE